ncbi:hypothetical protein G9A89_014049 [Geosiphon pyriformis]|nr:hypothetical protein G9A89_014049 [Geosiphon pyriformis]
MAITLKNLNHNCQHHQDFDYRHLSQILELQHNQNDRNFDINNQQHLPPVIVINPPPALPINEQQQQLFQPPQQLQQPFPPPQQQLQQPPQQQIIAPIAYAFIAKLEKFTSKEDNIQVWLNNVEKAIAANG